MKVKDILKGLFGSGSTSKGGKRKSTSSKSRSSKSKSVKSSKTRTTKSSTAKTSRSSSKSSPSRSKSQASKEKEKLYQKRIKEGGVPVQIKRHRDKNGGHYHTILESFKENDKKMHVSVGFSTKKTKGKQSTRKNYPLEYSPLCDGKESYMRRQGTVDEDSAYNRPEKGVMSVKDYEKAKVYGEKAKEKHFREKEQKK